VFRPRTTSFLTPLPLNLAPRLSGCEGSSRELFLDLTIFVVSDHDDRWSNTAITPNEYSFCTAGTVRGVVTRYQKVLITGALHAKNPGFPALCAG